MKILLAGATGVVGRILLPLLIEAGHEVVGTTRKADKFETITAAGGQPVILDVMDRVSTFALLEQVKPDVVIHQLTDLGERNFASNTALRREGMPNFAEAIKAVGVQKLIAQSISWIYVAGDQPSHEDEPLDLNAPEGRGRSVNAVYAAEQSFAGIPNTVILRCGLFYGPGTWYTRESFTTDQVRKGEQTTNDGLQSFVHVADAAQTALLALDWPNGIYNIVDDEPATKKDIFSHYAQLIGAPLPPYTPGCEGWERGESNAKARGLGWQPIYPTWRKGFKQELT